MASTLGAVMRGLPRSTLQLRSDRVSHPPCAPSREEGDWNLSLGGAKLPQTPNGWDARIGSESRPGGLSSSRPPGDIGGSGASPRRKVFPLAEAAEGGEDLSSHRPQALDNQV